MKAAGTIHVIRRGKALFPADEHAEEYIDKLEQGGELVFKRQAVKNPVEVRWYFSMLGKVLDNTDVYKSKDELREALMIATGYYEWHRDLFGRYREVPKSLTDLDLDEFKDHKEKALRLIETELGIDAVELMRAVDGTQKMARRA